MGSGAVEIQVNAVNAQTGSAIQELEFPEDVWIGNDITTSPDQRHVYAEVSHFGDAAIADIDSATFTVRYYTTPLSIRNGGIGILASPDGTRLYAPASTGILYVINTISRTLSAVPREVFSAALSPDGRRLYGAWSRGLRAINTTTFASSVSIAVSPVFGIAASATRIYVDKLSTRIPSYDASTLIFKGSISLPSNSDGITIDNGASRLFVTVDSSTFGDTVIIDTTRNLVVQTLDDARVSAVDPITHVLYAATPTGECAFEPPTFVKYCLPNLTFDLSGSSFTTTN